MRFTFTIRDWMWLCIVMALSAGWSAHVKYSQWFEHNIINPSVVPDIPKATLIRDLNAARARVVELEEDTAALRYGIRMTLTDGQRAAVNTMKAEYRSVPRAPGEY